MNQTELYTKLVSCLEEEITGYRHLLEIVRGEKDLLVASNIDQINENNKAKDALITRIRIHDRERARIVEELSKSFGKPTPLRLLDLVVLFDGDKGDHLRTIHSTLDLLIKRIREHNEQNELLILSTLKTLDGSMNNLRENLAENKTYKKQGQSGKIEVKAASGQFVSREA